MLPQSDRTFAAAYLYIQVRTSAHCCEYASKNVCQAVRAKSSQIPEGHWSVDHTKTGGCWRDIPTKAAVVIFSNFLLPYLPKRFGLHTYTTQSPTATNQQAQVVLTSYNVQLQAQTAPWSNGNIIFIVMTP